LLYSKGEEDGWVNEKQKKVKTVKCGAKAMPSGGTVMTRHDDDYDLWMLNEGTSDSSQSIQPGIVLATGTEAGQADHPADHAAGGAIVASDEARVAAIEEEWERQLTCEEEAAELEAAFEAGAKAAREWIGVAANREWIGMARELIGMAAREGDKDLKQELKQDLRQELKLPGVVSLMCL